MTPRPLAFARASASTRSLPFPALLIAGALAAAAALLCWTAQPAFASPAPSTVMANGVDMIAHPGSETDPIRYDAATNTLTLENALVDTPCVITADDDTYRYGVYADGDLTVRLVGTSTFAFPAYSEDNELSWVTAIGMESTDGTDGLVGLIDGTGALSTRNRMMRGVSCDGTLSVQGATLSMQTQFECLVGDGDMFIEGADLACNMAYGTDDPLKAGHALYQLNDATLRISSSTVDVEAPGGLSTGIQSWGPVVIDASTVHVAADNTAVYAGKERGTLDVADSTLTATSATTTAVKADAGISFAGASQVEAASGNAYQPSAAIHTYGTVEFALADNGFVHAAVPSDAVGRHDSDSAVFAAGFLTKDGDGRIVLGADNRIVDPVGATVVSFRDPDTDVTSAYIAQANGSDAGDVTVAVSHETRLVVEPTTLSFSATAGYSDVAAQRLTLSNAGDVPLHVSADPLELFTADLPNGLELQPGQTAAVSVRPVAGLGTGSYSEKLAFSTVEGAQASADATFQVAPAPAPQPTPAPPAPHRGPLAATGDALGAPFAATAILGGLGLLAAGAAALAHRARRAR